MSNAEEQLISNTINAVNNSLEGWFCHPFYLIIGTALWLRKPSVFLVSVEKIPLDKLFSPTYGKSPMDIEISFQMTKKGLYSICCLRDFRILKKSEHIRQAFLITEKHRLTILWVYQYLPIFGL